MSLITDTSRHPTQKTPGRFVPGLRAAALLTGSLLLPGTAALALPTDRSQAIEISAERAVRDEKAGYTIYSGDVILEQGSLHIEADKLTIFHDRESADRIVAVGTPARLSQQPELDKALVTASALRIVYEKSSERVLLRDAARISQEGAVVSGDSIDYFMAEQRVRADASKNDDTRVQVIIPAEVIEAESNDPETEEEIDGSSGGA
ncbi:MAG: lipopolysaccharide export system protein LptA [Halieaceae bacterium]|jgi:lipopolysaccharide export system protein LptA